MRERAPRLGGLYARAAIALAPGAHRLPGVPGGGGAMPGLSLVLGGVRSDPLALEAYRRVCCLPPARGLPVAYPHVLAFGLQMTLMTDPRFPFGPAGLVHIEDRIAWSGTLVAEDPLELSVSTGAVRAHPRGVAFTITTEARAGEARWREESTMLHRGGSSGERLLAGGGPSGELREVTHWRLAENLGRRYAAVSGDRNPIHLHPLAARLFGFRRAIAHGMWTMARSLAQLNVGATGAGEALALFRRPIELPSEVSFHEAPQAAGGVRFEVRSARDGSIVHLAGSVNEWGTGE